tara:strand:- start:2175 stop:2426 length:252 start_codon:yes stop_codon:yes gene_type:complete
MNTMLGSELEIGDSVLDANHHRLGVLTVKNIGKSLITFVRPYIHTSNFSTSTGVICYTGVEEFSHSLNSTSDSYELITRSFIK